MFGEYKYSVWAMSLKILLVYFVSIFINLLMMIGLLSVFEDSAMWSWTLQGISLIAHFGIIFMFIASDGRRDILVDGANEKREQRHPEYTYKRVFDIRKGFLAGAISQLPVIVLFIVWIILKQSNFLIEMIINVYLIPYFKLREIIGTNIFSILLFTALVSLFAGLAYFSAKAYRKKLLTIIKRNKEKAKIKGIANNSEKN